MSSSENARVLVVTGSNGDWTIMDHCKTTLSEFGIAHEALTASAHRQPERLHAAMERFESGGGQVYVCAAGMAAHLAGVVASQTTLPVLAVPLAGGAMGGLDALLSMVQMPRGVPVGTLAIGKHGAINAALLACQILALRDSDLAQRLKDHKVTMANA